MMQPPTQDLDTSAQDARVSLADLAGQVLPRWRSLLLLATAGAALGFGLATATPPTYTARAVFISPQQQPSAAASAIASLGALGGLAGAAAGIKSPADQYVSLMQSVRVSDHLIDRFGLMKVYNAKFRIDARKQLADNVRIAPGKKDSLIAVEVDDHDAKRAADIANAYVDELAQLSNQLALTETQQRRLFLQQQMQQVKARLTASQLALEKSGFTAGALKSEPKAAADAYARVRAELAAGDVRLAALRRAMTDNTPEVQHLLATQAGLRSQLQAYEMPAAAGAAGGEDYVSAYREFKYQETLFDLFARQFELAKADEAREGTLVQVLDTATPPERKSKPRRLYYTLVGGALGLFLALAAALLRKAPAAA